MIKQACVILMNVIFIIILNERKTAQGSRFQIQTPFQSLLLVNRHDAERNAHERRLRNRKLSIFLRSCKFTRKYVYLYVYNSWTVILTLHSVEENKASPCREISTSSTKANGGQRSKRRQYTKEPETPRTHVTVHTADTQFCYMALTLNSDKIMEPTSLILRLYIFGVYSILTHGNKCGKSEYISTAGECCPMCNIGSVVSQDCTGDYSTTCRPCTKGTFMNEPNGDHGCFQCKVCDRGLFILQDCTTIKDTICEVSDGYYCLDYKDRECMHAVEHSKCTPGQYLKASGTKASDTMCESCPPGSYSSEGVNCTKWTDCSDNSEIEAQKGTSTTDVKCKPERKRYGLIGVLAILLSVIIFYLVHRQAIKNRKKLKSPVEETISHDQTKASTTQEI